jgi:hypothetical protein
MMDVIIQPQLRRGLGVDGGVMTGGGINDGGGGGVEKFGGVSIAR